jgi:hypothetical protein
LRERACPCELTYAPAAAPANPPTSAVGAAWSE